MTKEKIIYVACAIFALAIIGYGITQGIRYNQLNKELKRLNEQRIEDVRNAKKAKQHEVNAYLDTLKLERNRADSLRKLESERIAKIKELLHELEDIEIPTTVDGRVDELNRISSELRD